MCSIYCRYYLVSWSFSTYVSQKKKKISLFLFFNYRYLMVNSKEYRVVVLESILCPTHFRDTLAKVLFVHLNVSIPYILVAMYIVMYMCCNTL